MIKKAILIWLVVSYSQISLAQICHKDSISETTPKDRFVNKLNGNMLDSKTGIVWKVCSEGQRFSSDNGCVGEPLVFESWKQSLDYVKSVNKNNGTSYRIPNIKELAGLVERACYEPAINLDVFPETPPNSYITSTPDPYGVRGTSFRYLNFEVGSEFTPEVNRQMNLRLIVSD
ncbi:hypothetical protein A3715_15485 [Oleiphilus sp. HI0009]|nr:hypothetical protein A3715_15485 [Oleiphilus sp. HI0009]